MAVRYDIVVHKEVTMMIRCVCVALALALGAPASAFQGPVDVCAADLVVVGKSTERTSVLKTEPNGMEHLNSNVKLDIELVVKGVPPQTPLLLVTWAGDMVLPNGNILKTTVSTFPNLIPGERYFLALSYEAYQVEPVYVMFKQLNAGGTLENHPNAISTALEEWEGYCG